MHLKTYDFTDSRIHKMFIVKYFENTEKYKEEN